jgi:signal transduction histidine kinase
LNALSLLASVMGAPGFGANDFQNALTDIRNSIERALQVSMDLLEWCRDSSLRNRTVERTWVSLEPLLNRLGREQSHAARRKGLALKTDFTAVAGWEMQTDSVRLGRLLANLLVNAVRYTPSGAVEFKASWRDEPTGKMLVLSVVDTGTGIAAEEQDSIFNPFERGQAGKGDDSGGSGLGLAVVERLVEELEIDLEVYSEFGRGSAFHLLVPWRMLRPISEGKNSPADPADSAVEGEKNNETAL